MPKRTGFQKSHARRRTFIREWREYRGLSQAQLGERLDTSEATISRIENAKQPYTQDTLEAIAHALQTDAASLLMRDPTQEDAMWSIWDQAKQAKGIERDVILDMARRIVGSKTGTNN